MKTWRRLVIPATLATVFAAPLASPSWGQPAPLTAARTTQPVAPFDGDADSDTVVHSWALSPAFNDPSQGGSRPNLSYEVAPGTEVDDKVTLFNLSNVQLTFRLYATDAFNNEDGSFDLLPGDEKPSGAGAWVTLPQENITLPPRSQATMPISVKVPVTAPPGDHAGGILASSRAEGTGPDGKVITLDRRTGSRMYIRVAGPIAPRLTIERLSSSYRPAVNPLSGTAEVTYRVENRGNVRMGGRQHVSVSGPLGLAAKQKPATELPELLPGEGVTMHVTFDGVLASAVAVTNVRIEPAPVGRDLDLSDERSRSLTLAPPYTVLALVLAGWLLSRARRAYLRRQGEQAGLEPSSR